MRKNPIIGELVETDELESSESVQDDEKIESIREAMEGFDGDWNEIPAIYIDEENIIIDGHHRSMAFPVWRALRVDAATFDRLSLRHGWTHALRMVADEYDDPVTWGSL